MAKFKCRNCKTIVHSKDAIQVKLPEKKVAYYFCCELCQKDFFQKLQNEVKQQKFIENEREEFSKVYEYVRQDLLGYTTAQQLPKSFITRVQDLRNGTMRGKIRNIQSKEGYSYDIILRTFHNQEKTIRWCLANKLQGINEGKKLNYIMAIIESHINDIYLADKVEKLKSQKELSFSENELLNMQRTEQKMESKKVENNEPLFSEEDLL